MWLFNYVILYLRLELKNTKHNPNNIKIINQNVIYPRQTHTNDSL